MFAFLFPRSSLGRRVVLDDERPARAAADLQRRGPVMVRVVPARSLVSVKELPAYTDIEIECVAQLV